jgi:hypothetical protein
LNAGVWFRWDRFVVAGPDSRRILAGFRQKITGLSKFAKPALFEACNCHPLTVRYLEFGVLVRPPPLDNRSDAPL